MRVLMLCGDFWHPPEVPIEGVKPLEKKGFSFDIIVDPDDFNPETLCDYPVVMLCKSGEISETDKDSWITEDGQNAFVRYVKDGGGLLAVHNATVPGNHSQILDELLGCRFLYHPQDCPVTVQPIKPHPITEGVGMFCETDEHYRLEILANDIDILIASYSPPQGDESLYEEHPYNNTTAWVSAAGYVRTHGAGHVCVLTPGHLPAVWANVHFQKTLENALNWCAGRDGVK
jgi:type 1 glutamine amidotransferase